MPFVPIRIKSPLESLTLLHAAENFYRKTFLKYKPTIRNHKDTVKQTKSKPKSKAVKDKQKGIRLKKKKDKKQNQTHKDFKY